GRRRGAPARGRGAALRARSVGAGNPRGFRVDHERLAVAFDRVLVDHHLLHVLQAGQVEHDVEQGLLEDRAQPPGAGLALERLAGDRLQRGRPHLEIDALHREQPLVLLDQRVPGFDQDLDQRVGIELVERGDHRKASDQLGDQPELDQVFGFDFAQDLADRTLARAAYFGAEADARALRAAADDLLEPVERPAADEQDVRRVDLHEVLVGVLAPALRRYRRARSLDQLQQRLLHAFAGDVAGDRRVVRLARDLVDFVD